MTDLAPTGPTTLIVSNNMVEAADLTEMLTAQGLGPVAHARDLAEAEETLVASPTDIRLLVVGLSPHIRDTKTLLSSEAVTGRSLLVIDGPQELLSLEGAGVLFRPFSTNDVLAELRRLGLRD